MIACHTCRFFEPIPGTKLGRCHAPVPRWIYHKASDAVDSLIVPRFMMDEECDSYKPVLEVVKTGTNC